MIREELCQMCPPTLGTLATRDAKLTLGPWAYVCESCFKLYCYDEKLGLSTKLSDVGARSGRPSSAAP